MNAGVTTRLTEELHATRDALRSAERALADERRRAQRYLDVAGTMIIGLDLDHRMVAVNRKGVAVLGHSEFALIGCSWVDALFPPAERPAVKHHLRLLEAGAADTQLECSALTKSGELRTIAWHLTAVVDGEGVPVGALAAGEDVTDRRRTEQQVTYLAYHDALTGLAEPRTAGRAPHARPSPAPPLRRRRRAAAHRPRLLQARQRLPRPRRGGHAAGQPWGRLQEITRATDLLARPGGDELPAPAGRRPRRRDRGRRAHRRPRHRRAAGAVQGRRRRVPDRLLDRHLGPPARRARRRRAAQPRRHRDVPRQDRRPRGLGRLLARDAGPDGAPVAVHAPAPRAGRATSCCCTTSRSSRCRAPTSPASRRCCAGTTPSAA